jgi:hypothetical protein
MIWLLVELVNLVMPGARGTVGAQTNAQVNSLGVGTAPSGMQGTIMLQNGTGSAAVSVNSTDGLLFPGEETVLSGPAGAPYGTLIVQPGSTAADPNGLLVLASRGQDLSACGVGIGTCRVAEALGMGGANFVTGLLLSGDFREEVNSSGIVTTLNAGGPTPPIATMLSIVPDVTTAEQVAFDGGVSGSSGQNSALLVVNGNKQFTFAVDDEGRLLWGQTPYITSCSESGAVVTCRTSKAHSLSVGQVVDVQGLNPQGYCGLVTVTAVGSSTTFSYAASSGLPSPSYSGGGVYDTDLYRSGAGTLGTHGGFKTGPTRFADLTACTPALEGTQRPVTDCRTDNWGDMIAGGGFDHVLAYCDGTNWTVMAR